MGNQLHSQVLWDATMAYWIAAHRPGTSYMIVMLRPVEEVECRAYLAELEAR
jgi:hypothetical protein